MVIPFSPKDACECTRAIHLIVACECTLQVTSAAMSPLQQHAWVNQSFSLHWCWLLRWMVPPLYWCWCWWCWCWVVTILQCMHVRVGMCCNPTPSVQIELLFLSNFYTCMPIKCFASLYRSGASTMIGGDTLDRWRHTQVL